jgi:hypothetical protein
MVEYGFLKNLALLLTSLIRLTAIHYPSCTVMPNSFRHLLNLLYWFFKAVILYFICLSPCHPDQGGIFDFTAMSSMAF